jgi:hypothetical protein
VRACGVDFSKLVMVSDLKPADRHLALALLHEEFAERGWSDDVVQQLLTMVIQSELFLRCILHEGVEFDAALPKLSETLKKAADNRHPPADVMSDKYVQLSTHSIRVR